MSEFLKIAYRHLSIGRVELWMEGTGEYDADGCEIFRAVREPTAEDLLYAERTEAGKIRTIRALVQLFLPQLALQTAFVSEQYDEDVPGSALHVMLNLADVVNREVTGKLKEMISDGILSEPVAGSGFVYQKPLLWTALQKTDAKTKS